MLRILYSPAQDGITNMASDQAIMEAVGEGSAPPTLRLYGWSPPCLSLGYAQRRRDVDETRLQARGWGLVRRPTGGRAILHADELTYSISLPQDHPLVEGDIVTSYHRLSNALREGLLRLRVETSAQAQHKRGAATAVCFETPGDYEITAQGKKLLGSAQVRRHKAVLQHGSLPLSGDISRICEVLHYPSESDRARARQQVAARASTLEAVAGRRISWEEAAAALVAAFTECFGFSARPEALSPQESLRLEHLRRELYGSTAWMNKR